MVICVVTAEKFEPGSADETVVSGRFVDDDRLMHGSIAAHGETRDGAENRKNAFESIPCGHYQG